MLGFPQEADIATVLVQDGQGSKGDLTAPKSNFL